MGPDMIEMRKSLILPAVLLSVAALAPVDGRPQYPYPVHSYQPYGNYLNPYGFRAATRVAGDQQEPQQDKIVLTIEDIEKNKADKSHCLYDPDQILNPSDDEDNKGGQKAAKAFGRIFIRLQPSGGGKPVTVACHPKKEVEEEDKGKLQVEVERHGGGEESKEETHSGSACPNGICSGSESQDAAIDPEADNGYESIAYPPQRPPTNKPEEEEEDGKGQSEINNSLGTQPTGRIHGHHGNRARPYRFYYYNPYSAGPAAQGRQYYAQAPVYYPLG